MVDFQEPMEGTTVRVVLRGRAAGAMAMLAPGMLVDGEVPRGAQERVPTLRSMSSTAPRALVFERVTPGPYVIEVTRQEEGGKYGTLHDAVDVGQGPEQTVELELPEKLPLAGAPAP